MAIPKLWAGSFFSRPLKRQPHGEQAMCAVPVGSTPLVRRFARSTA